VTQTIYLAMAALLFPLALHALFTRRNVILKLIAANIAASAVFLVLVAAAPHAGAQADPVPQALVLTGIVIAVSVTALALSVVRRLIDETGRTSLPEDDDQP